MARYEAAEAFIEVLNAHGVSNIFLNPGIDTVPVQVAASRLRAAGKQAPRLILCLDESVAMSAAHGHYMASGQPQVVLVHSELGTMQVGGAMHNAQWGRVPVILWAGLSSQGQRLDWRQQPYDQGSIMRNCVKLDHELGSDDDIHDALRRASQTALAEPRGPVYLSFPREVLTRTIEKVEIAPLAMEAASPLPRPARDSLGRIAGLLIEAENPAILAGYSGRYPESVASLIELAETLGAPVISGPTRVNFPTTHPLCAGFEQIGGSRMANPDIANTDVLLVIDYDTPYASGGGFAGPETKIIHIDIDPLTQGRPLWGRKVDIYLGADSRSAIPALTGLVREKLTPEKKAKFQERSRRLEKAHREQRERRHSQARSKSDRKPVSPDWLCRCIADVIEEDTILVNHTISQSGSVAGQIDRTRPGTLLACAGGSIQWVLGASLGARIASPGSTVVGLVTDGGFVWGCPVATLWSAGAFKAPFLAVVFNNQAYGAIKGLVQRAYGEEGLSDRAAFEAGVEISPPPDYASVARACGAFGRTVDGPADVLPALKEALARVGAGQPAVVDVRLER